MPKDDPEGYLTKKSSLPFTDAAKAKVKKAMEKAKVKKAKKEHKKAHGELLRAAEAAGLSVGGAAVGAAAKKVRQTAKDAGCTADKARKFVGVMGRFPGGRLRD